MTSPVVETVHGRVRGTTINGVHTFFGVPYGASTTGANRFRPPRTAEPWGGVRDASAPAPIAPQYQDGPGSRQVSPAPMSEDCLTLNVWTAGLAQKKPVLVWFHGGGFAA